MAIVDRNPRSGGSECIVFGHIGRRSDRFQPVRADIGEPMGAELSAHGQWMARPMRPGPDLETAPALVGVSAHGGDYCRTTGRVVLVSHRWSGTLQINNIGRKYAVDLYSEETRLALVDVVHELMVDVTPLARVENGVLALPPLPAAALVDRIATEGLWFRFLEPDAEFAPGPLRRAIELFRARPGEALRLRLMSALLPKFAARPSAPPPPAPPAQATRLGDEVRMLAAAVEGLALRAQA